VVRIVTRPVLRWILVVGCVLAVLAVLPWISHTRADAAPPAGPSAPALRALASCVQERRQLLVVMLFDASSSLAGPDGTDPQNQRVQAGQVALGELAELTHPAAGTAPVPVSVQLASFDQTFQAVGDWRGLGDSYQQIKTDLDSFAERKNGQATNYVAALRGARDALATQAAKIQAGAQAGAQPPCQAIVWFTDGRFDPAGNVSGPEHDKAVSKGVDELCRRNGIIDGLRQSNVTLVSIALGTQLDDDARRLLRRLTGEVRPEEGLACGDPPGPPPWGVFLLADDRDGLLRAFADFVGMVRGSTEPRWLCAGPPDSCAFTLEAGMRSFVVLIQPGAAGATVALRPPDGGPDLPLAPAGSPTPVDVAGAGVRWTWYGDAVVARGELSRASSARWAGRWQVVYGGTAVDHPTGRVYLYADLQPTFVDEPTFVRGKPWTWQVRATAADGGPLDPALGPIVPDLRAAVAQGTTDAPGAEWRDAVVGPAAADGVRGVTFDAPPEWTASVVTVRLSLTLRTRSGIDLSPPDVTKQVTVRSTLLLDPPALWPKRIVGRGATQAALTVQATDVGGCVWVDATRTHLKTPAGDLRVSTEPAADSRQDCLRVDPGERRQLTVVLRIDHGVGGLVNGQIPVRIATDDQRVEDVAVPVSVELVAKPRQATAVRGARRPGPGRARAAHRADPDQPVRPGALQRAPVAERGGGRAGRPVGGRRQCR
jgi:hypothetical protein